MDPNELPKEESKIEESGIEELEIVEPNETIPQPPPVYQRNSEGEYVVRPALIERLLSPQSLQWMMSVGGGMLVIGFVVWLWSTGLFENPVIVALGMGGAIGALVAAGIALVKFTRYQLTGKGLTLLGTLAMPLQLWFYHAQDLINLNDGGHLWIPAAIFCLVYAGIARVLRSPAFVYTLVGGVVLTGMLLMADQAVNQFWNLLPQVTFLVGLGWVSVFAERWFVETESDFAREKFGRAFRKAGALTIVGGLALLLASQVAGLFFSAIKCNGYVFAQYIPSLFQEFWAVGILCATAVGITVEISQERDRRDGHDSGLVSSMKRNGLLGIVSWIAVSLIGILNVTITVTMIAIVLAAAVFAVNILKLSASKSDDEPAMLKGFTGPAQTASVLLCLLAMVQFFMLSVGLGGGMIFGDLGCASLAQITLASLAAISCSFVANRGEGANISQSQAVTAFAGSVTAVAALWTAAWVFGATTGLALGVVGLALPLIIAATGLFAKVPQSRLFKHIAATMTTAQMVLYVPFFSISIFSAGAAEPVWIAVCLVAALIHYLCSFIRKDQIEVRIGFNRMMTYGYLVAVVSIALTLLSMSVALAIVSAPALVGLLLMVVGRIAGGTAGDDTAKNAQWSLVADYGRVFMTFANLATMLYALNMVVVDVTTFTLAVAVGLQLLSAVVAACLSRAEGWRNGFMASSILLTVTQLVVVNEAIPFSIATKVEFIAVIIGALLLGIGHVSWAREKDTASETTTAALWLGSLLTALPLLVALFVYRYTNVVGVTGVEQYGHEVAVLVSLSMLLVAGIMCRIRSTTIVGALGMMVYVASLLTMIPLPEKLQSISFVMMAGGGVFFTTAVLLSVYRDRIIAIPDRFRNGDGVFQVLKWR